MENQRFAQMTDEELVQLKDNKLSSETKSVIRNSVAVLSQYAASQNSSLAEVQQLSPPVLDTYLSRFYAEVRKQNGSPYSRNGIMSIRYGLQKHFIKEINVDIIKDETFASSREMFAAVLVNLKRAGLGAVEHKQPLTTADFEKLYVSEVLSVDNPKGLQNKVFVDVMVYLCNRGRENLRDMMKTDFRILTDSAGNRYVTMSDKLTKKTPRRW